MKQVNITDLPWKLFGAATFSYIWFIMPSTLWPLGATAKLIIDLGNSRSKENKDAASHGGETEGTGS